MIDILVPNEYGDLEVFTTGLPSILYDKDESFEKYKTQSKLTAKLRLKRQAENTLYRMGEIAKKKKKERLAFFRKQARDKFNLHKSKKMKWTLLERNWQPTKELGIYECEFGLKCRLVFHHDEYYMVTV